MQLCFGSVSAFYDDIIFLIQSDEVEQTQSNEELQPSDPCYAVDMSTMRCGECLHNYGFTELYAVKDNCPTTGCKLKIYVVEACNNCDRTRRRCGDGHKAWLT